MSCKLTFNVFIIQVNQCHRMTSKRVSLNVFLGGVLAHNYHTVVLNWWVAGLLWSPKKTYVLNANNKIRHRINNIKKYEIKHLMTMQTTIAQVSYWFVQNIHNYIYIYFFSACYSFCLLSGLYSIVFFLFRVKSRSCNHLTMICYSAYAICLQKYAYFFTVLSFSWSLL